MATSRKIIEQNDDLKYWIACLCVIIYLRDGSDLMAHENKSNL